MPETGPGPKSHALLTGPVTGIIHMEDGTPVNVTPDKIYFDSLEEAQAVAVKISEHYEANGHPDDIDIEDGIPIQREFVFDRELSNENLVAVDVFASGSTEQKG